MKKSKISLLVIIIVSFLSEKSLIAQEGKYEKLVSSMEIRKRDLLKAFTDSKQSLVVTETKNKLTDDQCHSWVGKRSLLQRTFSQRDDCTGDSLYNEYYESGLLIQGGTGDQLFFLGKFTTDIIELHDGMTKKQVTDLLGSPFKQNQSFLVYKKALHPEIAFYEEQDFDESVVLFFINEKLVGLWVTFYGSC